MVVVHLFKNKGADMLILLSFRIMKHTWVLWQWNFSRSCLHWPFWMVLLHRSDQCESLFGFWFSLCNGYIILLTSPVSWLGNFLFTLIFLFLKMHVKCLLISLKWPEKTIDTLLAYHNLRTENEVVLKSLLHWSYSGTKSWGWSHRTLWNFLSLLLCCFLILKGWT